MTFASGLYVKSFIDILKNDSAIDLAADTLKVALYTNTLTPDFDAASPGYSSTNESSGTGYSAGGTALGTPAVTGASGILKFDGDDTSWAASSIAAARGAIIYDDTITTPIADPLIVAVNFGADYATTTGTFTITWHANGIFTIDLVP